MNKIIAALAICLISFNASAVEDPRPGRLDSRIKQFEYKEGQVYRVQARYYHSSLIMLGETEKIVHIDAGDSGAWQIHPVNNYISIKPMLEQADSNMNVLTEDSETGEVRPYVFELIAEKAPSVQDESSTFMLKFVYPEKELKKRMAQMERTKKVKSAEVISDRRISADEWNMDYSYAGSKHLVPVRTFDDGEFTYFQFPEKMDTPAVFLVDENGNEALVNFHLTDKYLVVQRTGQQFILRDGDRATCIFNDSYKNSGDETKMKAAEV
ncbi:P-type conjugative transfer protein VirB9 [Gilvimarinus chinensis]|uniref:P-type conjugative transfer protein VirB9 n=1 Tax=Gilvimarinus chinensis TaxID=396005 RepID=UPI00035C3DBC|nr:P-type conjugative transfer protein VirB9 [Gilvimarinus chinensis]